MVALKLPVLEEISKSFMSFLPELTSRLEWRFRFRDAESKAEAIAEGVALSWGMYLSARQRGRCVTASNLAFFAGRSVAKGRKFVGTSSLDALSDTPEARQRRDRHVGLDERDSASQRIYRTFGDRRWRWPVVDLVAVAMDWQAFLARCDFRDRQIVAGVMEGQEHLEIARRLGISSPAVSQRIGKMRDRWEAQPA